MENYRKLTEKEVATLVVYGCSADNWSNVTVDPEFTPQYVTNVHFSGTIKLGKFDKVFEMDGGFRKHSGLYNCCLHNCTIGDDVFLGCNTNLIAPVTVEDRAYTAAGSTVTDDVPEGALAIARQRQTNIRGWADRLRKTWKK